MLTAFFTFFGIGAGIAVLLVMAGLAFVLLRFAWKFIKTAPEDWRMAMEQERARQARKAAKQQRD